MLKYLEKELNKTNEEINEYLIYKQELETELTGLDETIEKMEEFMMTGKNNRPSIVIAILCTIFLVGTIPLAILAFYMLPVILLCDTAVGALDIYHIISMVKDKIKKINIQKSLGNRTINMQEKYYLSRESDDCANRLNGISTLLLMKDRDVKVLESIIKSDNMIEELKKYPDLLENALKYEFDEYLREVSHQPVDSIHLTSLGKMRKLER